MCLFGAAPHINAAVAIINIGNKKLEDDAYWRGICPIRVWCLKYTSSSCRQKDAGGQFRQSAWHTAEQGMNKSNLLIMNSLIALVVKRTASNSCAGISLVHQGIVKHVAEDGDRAPPSSRLE